MLLPFFMHIPLKNEEHSLLAVSPVVSSSQARMTSTSR